MAGAYGVQPLFRFGVDVGGNDFADEDNVVTGGCLRFQSAFEIGDGISQQGRIDGFCWFGFAVELGEFVGVAAGLRAEE